MRETIGFILIIDWLGFCVWLWLNHPDKFRSFFGGIEKAVDDAAGQAADALHRQIKARERRRKLPPPGEGRP
ncbi:hypothetical protein R5W24_000558 [Gemmata sp. JC717]|uniref:hypothetical protein n=1 Tax=Gemmata algarum TaxID=2975278 RepID=UPI0021BB7862|nr:hypothetical protein [Gemmata algarum]MDY3551482.1 hypothetical protein [Gemmata algarum]